jgi:hypothetical protein
MRSSCALFTRDQARRLQRDSVELEFRSRGSKLGLLGSLVVALSLTL